MRPCERTLAVIDRQDSTDLAFIITSHQEIWSYCVRVTQNPEPPRVMEGAGAHRAVDKGLPGWEIACSDRLNQIRPTSYQDVATRLSYVATILRRLLPGSGIEGRVKSASPKMVGQAMKALVSPARCVAIVLIAGYLAILSANLPGQMSYDSVFALYQVRHHIPLSFDPPFENVFLGFFDRILPRTGAFRYRQRVALLCELAIISAPA